MVLFPRHLNMIDISGHSELKFDISKQQFCCRQHITCKCYLPPEINSFKDRFCCSKQQLPHFGYLNLPERIQNFTVWSPYNCSVLTYSLIFHSRGIRGRGRSPSSPVKVGHKKMAALGGCKNFTFFSLPYPVSAFATAFLFHYFST